MFNMPIKILKITKLDWLKVKPLLQDYNNYHNQLFLETDAAFSVYNYQCSSNDFAKMVNKKNKLFLAAYHDKTIIGFIYIYIIKMKFGQKNLKEGKISDLYVIKKYRGKGIAKMLWQQALDWFKENQCQFAQLHVLASNNIPQEIYKKWGFKAIGIHMKRKI